MGDAVPVIIWHAHHEQNMMSKSWLCQFTTFHFHVTKKEHASTKNMQLLASNDSGGQISAHPIGSCRRKWRHAQRQQQGGCDCRALHCDFDPARQHVDMTARPCCSCKNPSAEHMRCAAERSWWCGPISRCLQRYIVSISSSNLHLITLSSCIWLRCSSPGSGHARQVRATA